MKDFVELTVHDGLLPSGSRYRIEVPPSWNKDLLLHAAPIPVPVGDPPWQDGQRQFRAFYADGYAVASSANNIFWPLERAVADQPLLLDEFAARVGAPRRTIAIGTSIGGIMTAALVQAMPARLSGALPMCGNLAGAVAIHNRELDMAFAVEQLLGADTGLRVIGIDDPAGNLEIATRLLEEAQASPEGRARLAMVAAIGNVPGWFDATAPAPPADDFTAQQLEQYKWYEQVVFLVLFSLRSQIEQQAGGNPSWNVGVDYSRRFGESINRDQVEALYREAGLDVDSDLEILAAADRIEADPDAVAYLERHVVFNGNLGDVPVLAVHSTGDGLVTPDNMRAYREVVEWSGNQDLLRQLWVKRGGHCAFTDAERLTALRVLMDRIETGAWGSIEPGDLNAAARTFGERNRRLLGMGAPENAPSVDAAFVDFEPPPFPRPHDARMQVR